MTETLSDLKIAEMLSGYGVAASPKLAGSIRTYISILLRWNSKVSLTTVVDPIEILKFHFGESLFAVSKVPISHGRLADVGSGAGFPGLPLAMLLPDLEVILIESNMKKATFLSEVVRELKIANVTVRRERFEKIGENGELDFVTARALGSHDELLNWSSGALKASGKVILWLGERDAASVATGKGWHLASPISIPESERRVLLIGSAQLSTE
jgi:16S rRNA (guanine527-N7)-methyltransferase